MMTNVVNLCLNIVNRDAKPINIKQILTKNVEETAKVHHHHHSEQDRIQHLLKTIDQQNNLMK